MNLWLVLTAMIAVAAVFAAAPFIRRHERKRLESEKNFAVYRDQIKEVDLEAAQGAIDASQAEAARLEIKRRMLAVGADPDADSPPLSSGERALAAIGVSAVVVFGSVALFLSTADLDVAARPSTATADSTDARVVSNSPLSQADIAALASVALAAPSARPRTPLPSVDELVLRLVGRLQRNPKDVEGWRTLGWSYFNLTRYNEAAAAYAKAIELDPDSAEYRDGRIESLLRAANGVVTPEVRDTVEETLKRHPRDARALYDRGLALDQAGDHAGAEQIWNDLKRDLDPNDPWAKEIEKKIGGGAPPETAAEAAAKPATDQPPASSPAPPQALPEADDKGPTPNEVRAADAMAPAERSAMIERMVAGLADRLDKSPRDADGWTKLIRSWMVLGDADKAKRALDSALKAFSDDPEQMRRLTASAEGSGLKP